MVINNYSVAMDAQYFNLKKELNEAKINTQNENFSNDESLQIEKILTPSQNTKISDDTLSQELSKAILKNISYAANAPSIDRVEISSTYEEKQALDFQVQAFIQTDSKEIEISLDLSLSRSFTHKMSIDFEAIKQQLKDPLVLSFDGNMPSLSSNTFSFDIDSDGESDQISKLGAGSGFLAFDKNANGKVDNGNELFGTQSGDGFADLREYDDDKNGWIDENDAIFDKLRIWKKDENNDTLLALGEMGVGAIFLGNTSTPFELKSDSNQLLGEMRSSGFFLHENGTAGVISQIDLAVDSQTQGELDNLKKVQSDSKLFSLENLYKQDSKNNTTDSSDELMQKLDDKIKEVESKLSNADDEEKPAIQSQIAGLQAQKLAILARQST